MAAFNEESSITRRLSELSQLLTTSPLRGEIVVVSDGSTDETASCARKFANDRLHVLELPANLGKAAALNVGCQAARNEILVFADVRQSWAKDTLERLVENFSDPLVGAVSGDLVLEGSSEVMCGVGLYWRFEKWLRRQESRLHSTVGVSGSISAVRREFFKPIPHGTILDDVYWPIQVVRQGFRVVHDERALAFDHLPDRPRDEFRRKVRTLSGNFQLVARLPSCFLLGEIQSGFSFCLTSFVVSRFLGRCWCCWYRASLHVALFTKQYFGARSSCCCSLLWGFADGLNLDCPFPPSLPPSWS